jgi:hypothetical protein
VQQAAGMLQEQQVAAWAELLQEVQQLHVDKQLSDVARCECCVFGSVSVEPLPLALVAAQPFLAVEGPCRSIHAEHRGPRSYCMRC